MEQIIQGNGDKSEKWSSYRHSFFHPTKSILVYYQIIDYRINSGNCGNTMMTSEFKSGNCVSAITTFRFKTSNCRSTIITFGFRTSNCGSTITTFGF